MSRQVRLVCHATSAVAPITELDVRAGRQASILALTYIVGGNLSLVSLPQTTIPARADALWQHTCFEAFVRTPGASAYWELNFSPSLQWAAYRFSGYREGMAIESDISDPCLEMQSDHTQIGFSALVDLSRIATLSAAGAWQLGLSAVIEDRSGARSWWALAHPLTRPDFHHSGSFVLELPPEN
jgi:hypothetical protein